MKKSFFILCLLVIALTSCDPGYGIDFKLVNNSGHAVTFTSNPEYQGFWENHPNGITIESKQDTVFFVSNGLGSANIATAKADLLMVYGDSILFTFDDGKLLIYTQEEGNGPFNLEGDRYTWTTKRGNMFLLRYDCYGYLTYTITEEDYAQAE